MANQKIPGFSFANRDGGLRPTVLVPTTERLLIIGNALDGPVNSPIFVRDLTSAEKIFGPLTYTGDYVNPQTSTADGAYADNNLLKALSEALLGGGGNVICVRVGGTTAAVTGIFTTSIDAYGRSPGRVYNNVSLTAATGALGSITITLTQPSSKGSTLTWSFAAGSTLGNVVQAINNDTRNGSVLLTIPVANVSDAISVIAAGTVTLSDTVVGTNGTGAAGEDYSGNKSGYYTELTKQYGTFDTLLTTEFNVAVLAGIYADDQVDDTIAATTTTVAQDFANFLYSVSKEVQPCCGVIGLRPTGLKSPAELTTYALTSLLNTTDGYYNQTARWLNFGYFMNAGFYYTDPDDGSLVDVGRYISVIAGPDLIMTGQSEIGYYLENGAAIYAGMITSLPAQSATTNKALGTIKLMNGNFTKSIHEQLNQGIGRDDSTGAFGSAAYVTFKTNNTINRPVVVADNTCSQRDSDYRTLQVLRIANLAHTVTKQVMYPFIGEPSSVEAKTAMRTQLNSALQRLVDAGALLGGDGNGFKFTISSDPVETLLGQITITLFLRPALQIKYVKVVVNLTA